MSEGEQRAIRACRRACLEGDVMDTTVSRSVSVPAQTAQTEPAEKAAGNREVVQAVKALNSTEMFGDNHLQSMRDPLTQRMMVKLVNRETGEVVSQVPAEHVLLLAQFLKQTEI